MIGMHFTNYCECRPNTNGRLRDLTPKSRAWVFALVQVTVVLSMCRTTWSLSRLWAKVGGGGEGVLTPWCFIFTLQAAIYWNEKSPFSLMSLQCIIRFTHFV